MKLHSFEVKNPRFVRSEYFMARHKHFLHVAREAAKSNVPTVLVPGVGIPVEG